ncbi:PorT family protein [Paucihalobacter ruber]|uniref:PorT family protein n=1 Tax=Paucihalobacter ruber TaxID=2567861 RepID=A0A506PQW7_9FLAO|nr:porin family protein [Paucihalobacter ruber]TPV35898.1 PorT family protein [Paucihalobacter ruber]
MKNILNTTYIILFSLLSFQSIVAQLDDDFYEPDELYREDQFYFAFTYNYLANQPANVQQRGFPAGFHIGFIRDMPVNKRRNLAFGLGLGLSSNSYNSNILITSSSGDNNFQFIDGSEITFNNNKFTTYLVEMPFELRWRTSTAESYKFWRIHTGFKIGYVFLNSSKYKGNLGTIKNTNIDNFNNFQYGLTFSLGYSTFNFHVYYGLNNIFSDAFLGVEPIELYSIKIGLITYIL